MEFAYVKKILISSFLISSIQFLIPSSVKAQTTITVNPNTTYQTMTGWEVTKYAGEDVLNLNDYINDLANQAINDLGINRIRVEIKSGGENSTDWYAWYLADTTNRYAEWRCRRYATVDDGGSSLSVEQLLQANPSRSSFPGNR